MFRKILLILLIFPLLISSVSCSTSDPLTDDIYTSGDINPAQNNTGSLGSVSLRWGDAYIYQLNGAEVTCGSLVVPYENMSGAADDAARDALAGSVNGAVAVDSGIPGRLYYRAGGAWYFYDATPQ